ncbi:TetR/AcrR family transcriptional regulator [Sphingomonas oligophenolica]|uniref:TetR/AcrR family transcriptional regulator n=1 Tax=Sphingomonas oligophenolica TaxID=301154 RepID=A0A502CLT1_9SPHN|nr:TetR/AcrR family transcriptional regulator [Sphingomonas oligophenolica]TPG12726.1 TetR/AcrR family transcriptional regulator [Sphingomonas oligophenolica]
MNVRAYHHGDLRAALVSEGMALLVERAADAVSLREVARRAGVSATAVYRHFPDKEALMTALANEGLARLAAAQHAAFEAKGGGVDGFSATGAAYVRFALANPALFRMIFAHHSPGDLTAGDTSDDAMSFLLQNARALAPPGTDPRAFALQCWSLAHGLALLMLDGHVPVDDAAIDRIVDVRAMTGGHVQPGEGFDRPGTCA